MKELIYRECIQKRKEAEGRGICLICKSISDGVNNYFCSLKIKAMSYSPEQTEKYETMMVGFNIFEEMKQELKLRKCPLHHKRLKVEANWSRDYDIDISISKYCCMEFAQQVGKEFIDKEWFASVTIEGQ
ncbi:MAG: hypothetical protein JST86_09645 [Bacteroidetes bacterium]|nr:hypothetical protein [Bacteroidota bacterium]